MNRLVDQTAKNDRAARNANLSQRDKRMQARDRAVEEAISQRIDTDGPLAHYFSEVSCLCAAGIVEVRGCIPTDRLKQVLCSLILALDGVTEIDDQLDVVSSTGLSSIHPR